MNQMSGEKRLRHLFQPVKWVGFDVKNRVKYRACCVSNYNSRDGFITERRGAPRSLWDGSRPCGARSRQKSRDDADDHLASGSARSSTGPVCQLKFSAQLIKPTWL
jgi:hypothetical protein